MQIGDAAVYDQSFELIHGSVGVARAFDDKAGAYACMEALRRLSEDKANLAAKVTAVSTTTQEEIGTRGAMTAAYSQQPDFAIAVDVGHATDSPVVIPENMDPSNREAARSYVVVLISTPSSLSASFNARRRGDSLSNRGRSGQPVRMRAIQVAKGGVATGLLSIPLRYIYPERNGGFAGYQATVKLLVAVAQSLQAGERGGW